MQYSHCSSFNVVQGENVVKGQVIAIMGYTGNVYPKGELGKHLHVSMYYVDEDYKFNYKDRYNYVFNPNDILKLY